MSKFLQILLILFFSLTIISCSSSDDGSKSTDNTTTTAVTTTTDYSKTAWSGLLDNTTTPQWTAAEVVALLDRPTKIDNSTGCGNNNFRSTSSGGGILYPDGIYRSSVTGYYRHESRHYWASEDNETLLAYWNDYLGLSADIEDALDNYTKIRRVHKLIKDYQDHLELSDAELESKFAYWGDESVQIIREKIQSYIDIWVGERDNTKITFLDIH